MASLAHLQNRLGRLRAVVGREQNDHLDESIGERIQAWAQESLFRTIKAFMQYVESGQSEQDLARYHQAVKTIKQDIESQKTEEERRAEQRYNLKYPCTGAAEELYQKLSMQLEYEKRSMPSCDP